MTIAGPIDAWKPPRGSDDNDVLVFPMSSAQQRLWFLHQLEPSSPAYNIQAAFRLTGPLDVTALEQSLNEIVKRHDVLRTTFSIVEGEPAQVVSPGLTLMIPVIDLQCFDKSQREAEAGRLVTEDAQRPFDLGREPPVRSALLRIGGDEHVFLLTMHHIVSDGWSMGIFFRELSVLYNAASAGSPSPLLPLSLQYADFSVWQRQSLGGEAFDRQLSYWKKQLDGIPPVLQLPTDRPRPAVRTFHGALESFVLPKSLVDALKVLSRQKRVTLFMTLLAAFQALLYRYTGQDDIVIGSPIAGRQRAELEDLIGCFINTLVLRTDLSGDPPFRQMLARVRETALDAYAHQDLPFEKLVEELNPDRNSSRTPLFQVMFVLQNAPRSDLELNGLKLSPIQINSSMARFDLTLSVTESTDSLAGSLRYDVDLFDAATIARMAVHFQTLLESIAANPEQRLSELSILTAAERKQLLGDWNETARDYPNDRLIHQLFEAQAERTPDAPAAIFEDRRLTYRELNGRANQLARYLQKSGAGPETLVGIAVERSLEMVIGLIAVLKAGAAYVPLEPSYPQDRLAFMLRDSGITLLLTRELALDAWSGHGLEIVRLKSDWDKIGRESEENPIGPAAPENAAYVIYTSGSTGGPKGVLVEHRQILNYVEGIRDRVNLEAGASFAMVQPLSVDSSQTVIFPALISGGCLHIISQERSADPAALTEYFSAHPIDLLKIAPSHLAALETASNSERLLPRRWLIIGGESSRREWVEKLRATAACSIFSHYGPTEATVGVLTYEIEKEIGGCDASTVPVGRPLANTQVFLLDRQFEPVPIGVAGELYIAGRCLARGYLNRPELTAENFLPNPFSDEPGARLYKTGDLGRYLPDGSIEFLRRVDDQVKIRGFRVEPREVEATLRRHPQVEDALVVVRNDGGAGSSPALETGPRLAAYVVVNPKASTTASELRAFLKQKLPDCMVPAFFTLMAALPRSPHGKVDRRALPPPDEAGPELDRSFVEPRTATEKTLANIWAQVLGLQRIGVHDDFFELGGHSLLATQLISRVREAFRVELSVRTFFDLPTIAGVARVLVDDAAAVGLAAGRLKTTLEDTGAYQEGRGADFSVLTPADRDQIPVYWNDTKKDFPKGKCFHDLFAAEAERAPDAVAVIFQDREYTYRELNHRANRLARYLKKSGVGPEAAVAVCMERSFELIVALLGVLKAGGAYVPLDPEYPRERLGFMLRDAGVSVLLTESQALDRLPEHNARIVCLDRDAPNIAQEDASNPVAQATEANAACVIYTSGTTGEPKGAVIEHKSLINYLCWFNESPLAAKAANVPLTAKPTFDASLKQLFAPLLRGASVWILPEEVATQPVLLLKTIAGRSGVGLNCGPSLWKALLDAIDSGEAPKPKSLSVLWLGGDTVQKPLVNRTFAAFPAIEIWNLYGPTEATANATVARIFPGGPITLGRPIANTRIYILDSHLRPVPVGVPGELCIGGAGVARGYLNRPQLTAEKFLRDPFSDEPGARLYKTGDSARYLPDGNVEFLGRIDHQVKIRDFRVEPGEIEAALSRHPGVGESVVVARENERQENSLAAYVVLRHDTVCTVGELRGFLNSRLPQHMIPSSFVVLESLPLTPNGKVDRRRLHNPEKTQPKPTAAFVRPRTEVEKVLAGIWAGVLRVERVGIHDNFFELGGHSLLATQVISRVSGNFAVEVPLRSFFDDPTVAGLAECVARLLGGENRPRVVQPAEAVHRPLSFSQERLWFLDRLHPGNATFNLFSAFRLTGPLDATALGRSLDEIVRRHDALRTTFTTVDGRAVQVIAPELTVELAPADLQEFPESEREARAERSIADEARRGFDLTRGPLVRCRLFRLGRERHILLLTMHHIVSDGWSMGILFRELSALYQAYSSGKPSPLAELPVQYPDFANWQREWLQGEAPATQLSYWKKQLDGAPPVLDFPADHPRPPVQTHRGARELLALSEHLSGALTELSRREHVTMFMTLLAAFEVLLHRYSGQDDIVVGAPIAGRRQVEIEGLIGFFLNNLVLRTDVSGDPTFKELLARVRQVTVDAYTHQDLPFEKLLEALRPERDPSRTPLYQIYFNMITGGTRFALSGLKVEPISPVAPRAKFDLTLYVREENGKIRFHLVYNPDIFAHARMAEMLRQFERLLSQIVENPDEKIARLSLVTSAAEKCLPNPREPLDSSWPGAVHALCSLRAKKFPDLPAVVDKSRAWTYQELDSLSNRLANYLRGSGIERGDVVAIYGHRSAPLVSAVLGVLKAGAAFLILDPAYPANRLIDYLRTAKTRGWLQIGAAGALPSALDEFISAASFRCRIRLPRYDAYGSPDPFLQYSADDPRIAVGPDDIACIAFTSGSSGRPKGVVCRHGPLSHFLPWEQETFGLGERDRFSMLSGLAHDPLQRDIFTSLCLGATLCIPDPDSIGTPKLAQWMADEQITVAHLTPPTAELLTETAAPDARAPSLRYAFFVGDKLTRRDVERFGRFAPEATVIATYGTTETQRAVGYSIVPAEGQTGDDSRRAVYSLGRGVKDAQLLVLTAGLQMAGVGELGEIYLRSPHLAAGYLGDVELTCARFLKNPFTGADGDRLYKTGDLGRYLPDGNVEFVRRADDQVKIRGFRVEPGEIEAALERHPAIRNAVVIAREEPEGAPTTALRTGRRLVAYFTSTGGDEPLAGELRKHLRAILPEYMIPSAFVPLGAMPLTPNGKVDYRALPDPDRFQAPASAGYVAPRTAMEKLVAGVWREALGVERVGVYDNFFDLGGHSLLSLQAISRIEKLTGRRIPPAEMIYHTVEQLAAGSERRDVANGRPALKRRARRWLAAIYRGLFGA